MVFKSNCIRLLGATRFYYLNLSNGAYVDQELACLVESFLVCSDIMSSLVSATAAPPELDLNNVVAIFAQSLTIYIALYTCAVAVVSSAAAVWWMRQPMSPIASEVVIVTEEPPESDSENDANDGPGRVTSQDDRPGRVTSGCQPCQPSKRVSSSMNVCTHPVWVSQSGKSWHSVPNCGKYTSGSEPTKYYMRKPCGHCVLPVARKDKDA